MIFHVYLRGIFYPVTALGVCDHQHTELNVKHGQQAQSKHWSNLVPSQKKNKHKRKAHTF